MIGASLAMLLLLGPGPTASPTALVEQLGSPRFAEREEASEALARLGADALPALRAARDAKDPEVRARVATLVEKTEALLLTQPTLVKLDVMDRPLTEAVTTIGEQAGIKLALTPEVSPAWNTRVTLQESAPLPFWKALDRLCAAGNLQYNLGMQGSSRNRQPILTLFAGKQAPAGPISDLGPFRVQLTNLHFQRDVSFAAGSRPSEQFYMQVQVAAEPRLSVSQGGPIQILEAIDDRGQSMILVDGATSMTRQSAYFGLSAGPIVQMQAHLKRPELPGTTIRKLRGTVPLVVATRKADPLVVPLNGALGKTFRNDQVSLTIQKIHPNPNANQMMIDLGIRPQAGMGAATHAGARGGDFSLRRQELHQQQIEVLDAKGQIIPCFPTSIDTEGARVVLTVAPQDEVAVPTELRYYSLARAATEVNFEFADVMMP